MREASLLVKGGPNSGMVQPLSERPLTLGRSFDNDVVVEEPSVSRRHALIMKTPNGYVLRDLNSSNGTFVGRQKMSHEEHVLRHGDRIGLAGSQVMLLFRQDAPETVMLSEGPAPTGQLEVLDVGIQ